MTIKYFAADGSYGNAEDIIIVDTADWSDDMWEAVDMSSDARRHAVVAQLVSDMKSQDDQLPLEYS